MKNGQKQKVIIQEGEWIISIPVKTGTIKDLAELVTQLRNPDSANKGLALKPGWALSHV